MTKTIWAIWPEKPKGKEKGTQTERGFCEGRRGFRLKLKRRGGWYFIQGPHSFSLTASTDGFAFRGRRDRVDRREWSETKSDLHNTPTTQYSKIWVLIILWFKMQSKRPCGQRGMLVKHCCYWWFEVNIEPVPRLHFSTTTLQKFIWKS